MRLISKIENLISPIVTAMGYELWGVELHQSGKHTLLRVYIDAASNAEQKGINVDDCGKVSHQISALLDVESPISGGYNLEVSSPGLSRSFFKADQYNQYIGQKICLYLQQPQYGKRKFVGEIKAMINDSLELMINGEVFVFDLANINKANLSI